MTPARDAATTTRGRVATLLLGVAGVLVIAGFAGLHQLYLDRTHPDVLYMDSLRLLWQLNQWHAGDLSLYELWRQGSGHHGLINQLMLMLNVRYFSIDVLLANRVTGVIILAVVLALSSSFVLALRALPLRTAEWKLIGFIVCSLFAALCFSWEGFELLTLDLGLPNWIKNFSFVVFFVLLSWMTRRIFTQALPMAAVIGVALFGFLIVVFVAMGWSYAFVLSVMAVYALVAWSQRAMPTALVRAGIPVLALVLGLAVYVIGGGGVGVASGSQRSPDWLGNALLVPYAVGSAWVGTDTVKSLGAGITPAYLLGLLTLGIAVALLLARLRRGILSSSLVPVYLLGYGLLTAISVSIARGGMDAEAVMASRYHMDLLLILVGVLWLGAEHLVLRPRHSISQAWSFAFVVTLALTQSATYRHEWRVVPFRAEVLVEMKDAVLRGVPDEASAKLLQSPFPHARAGVDVMRHLKIGLFAPDPASHCASNRLLRLSGWNPSEVQGSWSEGQAELDVPACDCELQAKVYLPASFSARTLTVTDRVTGLDERLSLIPDTTQTLHVRSSDIRRFLSLHVSAVTVPARDFADSADTRSLGALWSDIKFACP